MTDAELARPDDLALVRVGHVNPHDETISQDGHFPTIGAGGNRVEKQLLLTAADERNGVVKGRRAHAGKGAPLNDLRKRGLALRLRQAQRKRSVI